MAIVTTRAKDPREVPAYAIAEVARFVRIPVPTLRCWITDCSCDPPAGRRRVEPLIVAAGREGLSFVNLIEAHVLTAIRRQHAIQMPKIRSALHWLRRDMGSKHPLAEERFETDGIDIFVRRGIILNASRRGQVAMNDVVNIYLRRIEHDDAGRARVLFPFTRSTAEIEQPKEIVIDPLVTFGRPVIFGTRVDTATVLERFEAGESTQEIADDLGLSVQQINEAVRCEVGWAKRAS